MASFKFLIVDSKANPTPIYVRFKISQKIDLKVRTGLLVKKDEWSKAKEKIKHNSENNEYAEDINKKLALIKNNVNETFNTDYSNGIAIDKQWLEKTIKATLNQPIDEDENYKYFFTDYVKLFLETAKNRRNPKTRKKISHRTIQDYRTTYHYLLSFEKTLKKRKIKLSEINLEFHQDYIEFLETTYSLFNNTIGGHIGNIKLFCKQAKIDGLNICSDFERAEFIKPSNETLDTYLNLEEINKIYEFNFENQSLDNSRDWFIVGLWTGLRISDLLVLNYEEHIDKNGFIEIENYKTGIITVIPIHEQVRTILEKRDNKFPNKISDQKFNKHLKKICKKVGITNVIKGAVKQKIEIEIIDKDGNSVIENRQRKIYGKFPKFMLVSSHICRRSFATNHYGEIDTLTLMNITGHKTERQFLDYVKITPREHAEKLKELWKTKNSTV